MEVELRPAYSWDCPECGREKFERVTVFEADEGQEQVLREIFGIPDGEIGHFQSSPEFVQCSDCGMSYEVTHYGE